MTGSRIAVVFALIALGFALAPGADPPAPKTPEDRLREAAKDAELHGIGIYEPYASGFETSDVTDWQKVVNVLRDPNRIGPADRIWELLPKEARDALSDEKVTAMVGAVRPSAEATLLKAHVVSGVRKMLKRHDFYQEKAFKNFPLSKELKDAIALGDKRSQVETLRLNRALLSVAFPDAIKEVPASYHLARVKVLTGKPVILVFSSYTECRWVVEVAKEANVVGVILCGSHSQEVRGVDVPIVYRAHYATDGKPIVSPGSKYFLASDKKQKTFPPLEEAVKEVTGKSFTDFQGYERTDVAPFAVRPSEQ